MHLALADWAILIAFLALIIGVGLSYTKTSGKDLSSFFLGGRNLPWTIAGLSMVATTFAADTPLAVADLVGTNGISGNWLWWNFLFGGMLTTFFFARLWRRANVLTEVELIELRYGGKTAAVLRGLKAIYLGVFLNVLIIGWVSNAMITIFEVFLGVDRQTALMLTFGLMLFTAIYSSFAGLMGIAVTDVFQFVVALGGCIVLAVIMLNSDQVGGIAGLKAGVPADALKFFPSIGSSGTSSPGTVLTIGIGAFLARIGVQWWASWYPGAEPGGGGYIAQRMMSTRTEKDSLYATLLFQSMHYCIRPWPWIIVGLCALQLYSIRPNLGDAQMQQQMDGLISRGAENSWFGADASKLDLEEKDSEVLRELRNELDHFNAALSKNAASNPELQKSIAYHNNRQLGYVYGMRDFLPVGLAGLLLAAFIAAFMSTISTQLNWGASYVVNDVYVRFINKKAANKNQIWISRATTLALMVVSLFVAASFSAVTEVWNFLIECGAGLGLVLILRWYWWRINAWSELTATVGSMIFFGIARAYHMPFPQSFYFIVGCTTASWIIVTFLTRPESADVLNRFYTRVQPDGAWNNVRRNLGMPSRPSSLGPLALAWIFAVALIYGILFLSGSLILAEFADSWKWALLCLAAMGGLGWTVKRYELFADNKDHTLTK